MCFFLIGARNFKSETILCSPVYNIYSYYLARIFQRKSRVIVIVVKTQSVIGRKQTVDSLSHLPLIFFLNGCLAIIVVYDSLEEIEERQTQF